MSARHVVAVSAHAVVDYFAVIMIPLLTIVEARANLTDAEGAWLLTIGGVASGGIQPLVAWLGDRHDTRFFGPAGLLIAGLGMGALPYLTEAWHYFAIQVIAHAGVGAFHPIGAASVGALFHHNRSFGISIFFVMGMVGHFAGNVSAPWLVSWGGFDALVYLAPAALVAALLLRQTLHRVPHRHEHAHNHVSEMSDLELRQRWTSVMTLFLINAIRFTVNMMLIYLVIRWAENAVLAEGVLTRDDEAFEIESSKLNGMFQAAMVIGMGVGGLVAGKVVRQGHERGPILGCALFGAGAIIAFPYLDGAAAYFVAIAMGIGYASTVPLTIAMGQRLLPHRTGLASSMMLGCAWIFSAFGPRIAESLLHGTDLSIHQVFLISAIALAVSGVLALTLSGELLKASTRLGNADD